MEAPRDARIIMYRFTVGRGSVAYEGDLQVYHLSDEFELYGRGIPECLVREIVAMQRGGELASYLGRTEPDPFFLCVVEPTSGTLTVYNDHFGSNEVYWFERDGATIITDNFRDALGTEPVLRRFGIYEHVVFQEILPPDTMYENVFCIPAGAYSVWHDGAAPEMRTYWKVEDVLTTKAESYDALVCAGRQALLTSISKAADRMTAVALSGGVDSGGLLGMHTHLHGDGLGAISVGARGKDSFDLGNARRSAEFHRAKAVEVYPTRADLARLWEYAEGLSQPVCGDTLFVYSYIQECAKRQGYSGVMYGFGAEMLLGNLKISKLAHWLRFERFLPRPILRIVYPVIARVRGFSQVQKEFLVSCDWVDRFMYTRGALYPWQRTYFTADHRDVWRHVRAKTRTIVNPDLDVTDRMVKAYLFSWVNYLQRRAFNAFSRRQGMTPVMPFDTVRLAHAFFHTPFRFRKINRWNKQIIRDIMRPFVPDALYAGPVRSLIVPYSELLKGRESSIISYLRTSVIGDAFDFDAIERDVSRLAEPGLFLFRLLGVAVWYDANHRPERRVAFERIFAE